MDSGSYIPLYSGNWFVFKGKRYSFLRALCMLKRDVLVASDDDLLDWFAYYWDMKTHFWDIGAIKFERNVSAMLDVCWRELAKRGFSQIYVVDGDVYYSRLVGDVQLAG